MPGTEPSIRLAVATSVENQAINILRASDSCEPNALVNGAVCGFRPFLSRCYRPAEAGRKGKDYRSRGEKKSGERWKMRDGRKV